MAVINSKKRFISLILTFVIIFTSISALMLNLNAAQSGQEYTCDPFSFKRYYNNSIFSNFAVEEPGYTSSDSVYIKGSNSGFGFSYKITGLENGYYIFSAYVKSSGGQTSAKLTTNVGSTQSTEKNTWINYEISEWTKIDVPAKVTDGYCWIGGWYNATPTQWIRLDCITFEKVEQLDIAKFSGGKTIGSYLTSTMFMDTRQSVGNGFFSFGCYQLEPFTKYTLYYSMRSNGMSGDLSVRTFNSDNCYNNENLAEQRFIGNQMQIDTKGNWATYELEFTTSASGWVRISIWLSANTTGTAKTLSMDGLSFAKSGKCISGYISNSAFVKEDNNAVTVEDEGFISSNHLKIDGTDTINSALKEFKNAQNGVYVLSGYVKSAIGNTDAKLVAYDGDTSGTAYSTVIQSVDDSSSIDDWRYVSLCFKVTNGKFNIGFNYNAQSGCELFVDGIKLERLINLVTDSTFNQNVKSGGFISDKMVELTGNNAYVESMLSVNGTYNPITLKPLTEYIVFASYKAEGNVTDAVYSVGNINEQNQGTDSVFENLLPDGTVKTAQLKIKTNASGKIFVKVTANAAAVSDKLLLDGFGYKELTSEQPAVILKDATFVKTGLQVAPNERGVYVKLEIPIKNPPKSEKYEKVEVINNLALNISSESNLNVSYDKGGKITDSKLVLKGDGDFNTSVYKIFNGSLENGQYTVSAYVKTDGIKSLKLTVNTGRSVDTERKSGEFADTYSEWTLIQIQDVMVRENYLFFAVNISGKKDRIIQIDGVSVKKVGNGEEKAVRNYVDIVDLPVDKFTRPYDGVNVVNISGTNEQALSITKVGTSFGVWYDGGVNDLENGKYTLTGYVKATGVRKSCHFIANSGTEYKIVITREAKDWVKFELLDVPVSDNKLAIGIWYNGDSEDDSLMFKDMQLKLIGENASSSDNSKQYYSSEYTLNNFEMSVTTHETYKIMKIEKGGSVTDSRIVLDSNEKYSASLYKNMSDLENGEYTVTADVRTTGGQSYVFFKASSGDTVVRSENLNNPTPKWKRVELRDVKVSDGKLNLIIYTNAQANQKLEIDGITIKKVSKTNVKTKVGRTYEETIDIYAERFIVADGHVKLVSGKSDDENELVVNGNLSNGTWYWGKIHNLVDGKYTLRAQVKSTGGQDAAKLIANNGVELNAQFKMCVSDWVMVEIRDVKVKNGKLAIGVWYSTESDKTSINLRNIKLLREGEKDVGISKENYSMIYPISNTSFGITSSPEYDSYNHLHIMADGKDNKLRIEGKAHEYLALYKSYSGNLEDGQYTVALKVKSSGGQKQATLKVNNTPEVKTEVKCYFTKPISNWQECYINNIEVKDGYLFFGIFYEANTDNEWLEIDDVELRKVGLGKTARFEFDYADSMDITNGFFVKSGLSMLTAGGCTESNTQLVISSDSEMSGGTSKGIKNLTNGYYTVRAWVKSSGNLKSMHIFANPTSITTSEKKVVIKYQIDTWTQVEINDIYVSDGYLLIGLWAGVKPDQWCYIDGIQLLYQGDMKIMDYKGGGNPKKVVSVADEDVKLIEPTGWQPDAKYFEISENSEKSLNALSEKMPFFVWPILGVAVIGAGAVVFVAIFTRKKKTSMKG